MKQPRIPIGYVAFNNWLNATNTLLQAEDPANPGHFNWERLGLSGAEALQWDGNTTNWNALYAKYTDKALKNLGIIHLCRAMKGDITEGTRSIVNRLATSGLMTPADALTFNIVLVRKKPEKQTTVIKESVITGIERIGSGEMSIQCRYVKDTKRPSLLPKADGVEYAFKITSVQPADPATVDPEGDGFRIRFISKAKFVFKSGTANKGKYLIILFRWVNSKYPELAGPWSEAQVMVII